MKKKRLLYKSLTSHWTTEQDSILIENSYLSIEELLDLLPFTPEEIHARKFVLGIYRRTEQMRKI